uniref:THAP-type domain-containing protein n=1 Tax=Nothobranchius rachovii TaxID=451742 RepID=A0A1A8PF11_9TELE
MPHCAAFGCNFQSEGNKGSDVSLHSFPTGKKRRKQWEDACGRTQLPKDPRLCSQHFSPDAFEAYSRPQLLNELTRAAGYKRRWKLNALPTIFPHKGPKHLRRDKRRWTLS